MNASIPDTALFSPFHQLASSLSVFYPQLSQQYSSMLANPRSTPTNQQLHTLLECVLTHSLELFSTESQLQSITALTTPIIFTSPQLAAHFVPLFIAALTSNDAFFDSKVDILYYMYNIQQQQQHAAAATTTTTQPDAFRYEIILAIARLVLSPASASAYLTASNPISIAVVEQLVADITSTITPSSPLPNGMTSGAAGVIYRTAYDMMVQTSTTFSQRALLSSAFTFLTATTPDVPEQQQLVLNTASDLVTLALSFPSHQVSLDRYLSYDLLLAHPFIKTVFAQQFPAVYQLLNLHLVGTLPQILAYVSDDHASPFFQVCNQLHLDTELTRSNLIALALVPALHPGKAYKFTTLQTILQLSSVDLVEEVLVDATTHGQISTKIDQIAQTVHVSRVIPRFFNPDRAWNDIHLKLIAWNKAIQHSKRLQQQ